MSHTFKTHVLSAVAVAIVGAFTVLALLLAVPTAQPAPVQGSPKSQSQVTAEVEHVAAYNRGWLDAEKGVRADVEALYPGRADLAQDYEDGQIDGRADTR